MEICIILPKKERKSSRKSLKVGYYETFRNLTTMLGVALANYDELLAESADDVMDKLDDAGNKLLRYGIRIGYWVCIVMAIIDIIKALIDGDTNAIWGIIVKYGTAFGGIFLLRFMMDLIMGVFS